MKKTIILLLVFIVGCNAPKQATEKNKIPTTSKRIGNLEYKFKIISPLENDEMSYQDSNINAKFEFGKKQIGFTIKNKTETPVKLIWDDAVMAIFGESNKIMHKGVKFIDRSNSMPPTTILPNTTLDDMAVPTKNVDYVSGYSVVTSRSTSNWETKDILIPRIPSAKFSPLIDSLKGTEITLYLPIMDNNNKIIGYTFKFKVTEVIVK